MVDALTEQLKNIKVFTVNDMFVECIENQKEKEKKQDIWKNSIFKDLPTLQSNNVGNVGEIFLRNICIKTGIPVEIDGTKTKEAGGGTGDGKIKDHSIEIKTAHQGSTAPSFQHELGELPWKAEYMVFIDISPECIYLTIFPNFTEEHYKSGDKCEPYFPTKSVTWRKQKGAFKFDTSVSINEANVEKLFTFKITSTTDFDDLKTYILSKIN
uniref:Restriction endonuclease n=1 Tax=viral metagenome TaxID=1070528 RepID=A0A6C0AYE2_9ZZZZ